MRNTAMSRVSAASGMTDRRPASCVFPAIGVPRGWAWSSIPVQLEDCFGVFPEGLDVPVARRKMVSGNL